MGISYETSEGVLTFLTRGEVDFAGGLQVLQRGFADAAAKSASDPSVKWHLLFDIRESTENRSSGELRGIAEIIAAHRSILTGRCALVVASPLYYGLGRVFAVFMEGFGLTVTVVHSGPDALAWLRADSR
ncbi:MAG: hypothetical protein FJY92_09860 [Candidatus Hydrogenedentes bacterium]|nr:hypothetical protein [Candidatus Hydrogenedentota bacterium]